MPDVMTKIRVIFSLVMLEYPRLPGWIDGMTTISFPVVDPLPLLKATSCGTPVDSVMGDALRLDL
jgi:hypothetical protein